MTDESIFAAALAIPDPGERAAYLDRACAGNPALRREVEGLLAAHAAPNPLDRPPADLARTGAYQPDLAEPAATVGDRVGPYKLLERIGEGGMGEVWVADQLEPIKRRVALKLIKPGMDSRSVLARFEAERQALAVMDHPNIAKVLDAGTTPDGRPYFVMELVKGTPITEFCDIRKLTPRERLELFVPVCQAIQHAHMKGIIHRDIKPSNVLVELHDDRAVPKVIDFGVAKAVGQQLTEKTIYTGFGALIGTPAYMAPEQATFNALDVDTRADVYALGVLLYELLAGSPPVEPERLKKAALDEVLRIVRDEEPPRPSLRLSTSQSRASIAAVRGTEPEKLSALMRGELDWIVMKALEKDRTRRYETANGFAADVQRYLAGEQVQAVPPSLRYRVRKFYRRNRAAVLSVAIFVLFVGTLSVSTTLLAIQARRAAELARAEAARAEAEAQRAAEEEAKTRAALTLAEAHRLQAEVTLCRSVLRPVGFNAHGTFHQAELNAPRDASAMRTDDLRLLVLREALRDPCAAFRAARRTERFVQATVGSSPARRRAALDLVTPIQNDPNAHPHVRLLATWVAIELYSPNWNGFAEGVNLLARLRTGQHNVGYYGTDWANFLTPTLLERLDARHATVLADALVMELLEGGNVDWPQNAQAALLVVAPKLEAEATTRVVERLVASRETARRGVYSRDISKLVPRLLAKFPSDRIDPLIRSILPDLKRVKPNNDEAWWTHSIYPILAALAPRAGDGVKRELLDIVLTQFDGEYLRHVHRWFSEAVPPILATCLPVATKEQIDQTVGLVHLIFHTAGSLSREDVRGLALLVTALRDRMTEAQRWELAWKFLNDREHFPMYEDGVRATSAIFKTLSPSYSFKEPAVMWRDTIDYLRFGKVVGNRKVVGYTRGLDPEELDWLIEAIPPEVANQLARDYYAWVGGKKDDGRKGDKLDVLSFLAPKIDPALARTLAKNLLDEIPEQASVHRLADYAVAIQGLVGRLPAEEQRPLRPRIFDAVFERLRRDKAGAGSWRVGILVALLEAIDPSEREPYRAKLVGWLMGPAQLRDAEDRALRAEGLAKGVHLHTPDETRRAADWLLETARTDSGSPLSALIAFVPRMDSATRRKALDLFLDMITRRTATEIVRGLQGIEACAAHLDPDRDDQLLGEIYAAVESRREHISEYRFSRRAEADQTLRVLALRMKPAARETKLTELLRYHLDRASLATSEPDMKSATLILQFLTTAATLEEALDHPAAIGPHRVALLKRLARLRHPEPDEVEYASVFRGDAAQAAGGVLRPGRYRTAWEYFR